MTVRTGSDAVLGPSTTWLLRRLAAGLEASPAGFDLPLADTARALGLGDKGGRHSPFMRALARVCQFDLAQMHSDGELEVRRRLPPLNRRQLVRLPTVLQWVAYATPLWHGVDLCRGLVLGTIGGLPALGHVAYLLAFVVVGGAVGRVTYARRLQT